MYHNLVRIRKQDRMRMIDMKKILLNYLDEKADNTKYDYQLDPTEEYVINLEKEL